MKKMYNVWLGDVLLASAASREEAIKAAIREYEHHGSYGEYPLFSDRDALVAALSVDRADKQGRKRHYVKVRPATKPCHTCLLPSESPLGVPVWPQLPFRLPGQGRQSN